MLYGLIELLYHAVSEFHRLASDFSFWLKAAIGATALMGALFALSGRLVHVDWKPGWWLGGLAGIALPISFLAFLLWPASTYLKPAVVKMLGEWQKGFLQDDAWNQESFRRKYWAVHALKKEDGTSLEDFTKYPPPEQGGHLIPNNSPESRAVSADVDSKRVAQHFETYYTLLANLLWTGDRPLPELIKADMDEYFRTHSGGTYDHHRSVELVGTEMQKLLEQKIGRIILTTRIALAGLLLVLWIPLYAWAMYDAWKKLEPFAGKS
jgi:hypothetical protein